ncbi:MAG: bacillithiol biosynthesis cysteine-adding enzyme BshC, partial [Actinobacteria bacterium]|nr:bacillithiol biosynthesis cysteine-adding enzyme BshC [Actinomycetota bacterium]
ITVLKLSRFISETIGIRTVPCFWNASDDSSKGQVDSIGVVTDTVKKIKIDTANIKKNTRFSSIYLEKEKYIEVLENLESLMPKTDFSEEVLGFLRDSTGYKYMDPEGKNRINLPGLFSNMVMKLFKEYGIIIIDPSDERLKRMGAVFLKRDMEKCSGIAETVNSRGDELKREGYHSQLEIKRNTLNHLFNVGDIREKVECLPDMRYRVGDKIYLEKELTAVAGKDPGLISWNVIMRPVIQDTLFPVIATVCGPGEVSYFAQISGVYGLMDIKLPVIYPRFSGTIIEKNISRIIKRFGSIDDLAGITREQAIKRSLDESSSIRLEGLAGGLEKELEGVLESFEKRVSCAGIRAGSSFDRIKRNIRKEVRVLVGKIYSELKKESKWVEGALDRFYLNLFPEGGLQERQINFFHYANKYGIGIMEALYGSFNPFEFEHKLLYLSQDGKDEENR